MSWARLDEGFPDSPKIEALSDAAFRAHVRAICHSARVLSDGFVLVSVAKRWGKGAANECLSAGVWHAGDALCIRCRELLTTKAGHEVAPSRPDAVYVHDFLDYNRSRVDVLRERELTRARKQRWAERGNNALRNGAENGVPPRVRNNAPTRPGVPSEHLRARTRGREEPIGAHPPLYAGRCPECNASLVIDDHGRTSGHADDCPNVGLPS